jgi:hypothetical protein
VVPLSRRKGPIASNQVTNLVRKLSDFWPTVLMAFGLLITAAWLLGLLFAPFYWLVL